MSQPTVWIIGDWRHADFSAPLARLKDIVRCAAFDDTASAIASCKSGAAIDEPTGILLVQSRPGQFAERDVERLHAIAPLARLIALVGPWCEGEMRSGRPWPGVVRVPWRAWQVRLAQEVGLAGELSASPKARTVTTAESIETTLAELGEREFGFRAAEILTGSRSSYESIADVLNQLKVRSVWHSTEHGESLPLADLVIFDGWDQVPMGIQAVSSLRLLLLHFPRPDDHTRAASLGIAAVVGQPLLVTDVLNALDPPLASLTAAAGGK